MKGWIISIVMSVIVVSFLSIHAYASKGEEPLSMIAHEMQKQHIEIVEWSLYARQGLSQVTTFQHYDKKIHTLKQELPQATWTTSQGSEDMKTVGTYTYQNLTVRIVVNYVLKQQQLLISVQFLGKKWNGEQYKKQEKWIKRESITILGEEPIFFTCVKGLSSDNLRETLQKNVENILIDFSAKEIEQTEEGTFAAVSAYTEQWKNELPTQHSKMNMQVAYRQIENNQATIVIGTPIITMEY